MSRSSTLPPLSPKRFHLSLSQFALKHTRLAKASARKGYMSRPERERERGRGREIEREREPVALVCSVVSMALLIKQLENAKLV